jgi:hypothetical protein
MVSGESGAVHLSLAQQEQITHASLLNGDCESQLWKN